MFEQHRFRKLKNQVSLSVQRLFWPISSLVWHLSISHSCSIQLLFISRLGCEVLLTHFETVARLTPNCSEIHLLWMFFSARTTFKRFILLTSIYTYLFGTKVIIIIETNLLLRNYLQFFVQKSMILVAFATLNSYFTP